MATDRFALPRDSQRQLMIGAGGAVALGLVLGLWARPNLGTTPDAAAAKRPAVAAVPIEVSRPAPPTTASGKLEVLSPDVAAASRQAIRSPPSLGQAVDLAPPPPLPAKAEPQPLEAPPLQARAGYDCAGASGLAEQMVCSDPGLAAADQEMSRAYRRALRAGGSPSALRADQRDWLGIREDAAHISRRALAQIYQQRIDELNAAADEAGAPDDGY